MFLKFVALILSLGLVACAMLTLRQQRIEAAHELTKAQARLASLDREVLRLKLQIAARVTPECVEQRAARFGVLAPLSMDRFRALVRREAAELGAAALAGVHDGDAGADAASER